MSQNTSSAVMQQRSEPHESLDDFPTPPWAARAVCEYAGITEFSSVWEPSYNRGYLFNGLKDYFEDCHASDIYQYGSVPIVRDFLIRNGDNPNVDWVITNPPFMLAEQFAYRALEVAKHGVALIVRSAWLEGKDRYKNLFSKMRPTHVFQHSERVIMAKGVCRDPSKRYWNEKLQKWKRPSTATSYSWVVWNGIQNAERTDFDWIPPCRAQLERDGDYA
jgi:hypothetical protein